MEKFKKSVALVTAAALLAGTQGIAGIGMNEACAAEPLPELLVDFDFEGLTEANQEIKYSKEGTDIAKATGTYTVGDSYAKDNHALHLDNSAKQFLNVTKANGDSLLKGKEEITISFEAKHEQDATNWVVFASRDAKPPVYRNEHYLGILRASLQGGALQVERYNSNEQDRPRQVQTENPIDKSWTHVDVVVSETDTAIYVNGKEEGRLDSASKLSDVLGGADNNSSILQIGKANWESGEYFKGSIDNFRIYDGTLTQEQITAQYQDYVLECDADALTLTAETDRDLTLPTAGKSGETAITWKSDNPDVLSDDGVVTRGQEDVNVTMTATLTAGDKTVEKTFTVTVKQTNPADDILTYKNELTLNAGFVSEDLTLPAKVGTADVTWEVTSGDGITIDKDKANVTRADKNQNVTLTATLKLDGADDVTKEFPLTVIAKGKDVATYVSKDESSKSLIGQNGGMKIAAEGTDGYTVMHKNQPILFSNVGAKRYAAPEIFRKADGTFGVVAADGGANANILLYSSTDLINYTDQKLVTLEGISRIDDLDLVYDSADELYKLFIKAGESTYLATSEDLETFTEAKPADYTFEEVEGAPSGAILASETALTAAEYKKLAEKFKAPANTSASAADVTEEVKIQVGEEFKDKLSGTYTAEYSNGEKHTYDVKWDAADLAKVDNTRPGTYTVKGTMGGSAYYTDAETPLIEERADPYVVYDDVNKCYYFTSSYPVNGKGGADGYDRLIIRKADTIDELADAEEIVIWDESNAGTNYGQWIWAPELHKIGNDWYFISTAGTDGDGNRFNIRPFMMKCEGGKDLTNPENWETPQRVKAKAGDPTRCFNAMSLDMTYFEAGGNHYLVWADVSNGDSSLYIATIDPSNPTQLTSNCTIITIPEYSWELVDNRVDEGPAVIQKDGKVYLAFSASGTGSQYCVGLLTGDASADLTKKENWEKTPYPIMTSADFNDVVSGPGHNSFTVDSHGNPVIVYHARPSAVHAGHSGDPLYDACRHCYVKPVVFDSEGKPVLNQSDKEFAGAAETVTAKIIVEGEAQNADPVLEYDFDEEYTGTAKDKTGNNDGTLSEAGASYVQDDEYGQVLYLDGDTKVGGHNGFLSFPKGFFDNKDSVTISMDVQEVSRSGNYFTFGISPEDPKQPADKYLFLKLTPIQMKAAITTKSYGAESQAIKNAVDGSVENFPNNNREWINVKLVVRENSISLYRDGKLIVENLSTGISMSDLGENLQAYLGKSFYTDDKYFRGYFDNVKVYDYAMTDAEVKDTYTADEKARMEKLEDVNRVAAAFYIPHADEIKGNITLPAEKDGVSITWKSSNEDVISTKVTENDGYDATPAGVVTRKTSDKNVTLTATFSKDGAESVTKTYDVTVKAAPKEVSEEDYVGYLFVRFNGTEENMNQEQTYFSVSEDGLNWTDLNGNKPVLSSTIGESGLRDHYIARSPEGDKYYMIATDLSIYNNTPGISSSQGAYDWWGAGGSGSHSIVVWESDDLVNWSEPWLSEIAPEAAGCTWAPEFIYDEKTGEYVVYWSSTTLKTDDEKNITQNYENHAIYYCKTRDFRTYTEPKLYHEGGKDAAGNVVKVIDSTMIQNGDTYYRFTKNETKGIIEMDKSDAILGDYTKIPSKTLTTDLMNAQGAVEGPIIFKMNEKNAEGKDQWCLMVDRFARGQGYYPLITTDLESGNFMMLNDDQFSMPSKYRHGYVMPVTAAEYGRLQRKWGDGSYLDKFPLQETIKTAEAVDGTLYTEESYAALEAAITTAKAALETVTSNAEVDAAAAALQAVIDALELKDPEEVKLTSIQVTAPTKTEYQVGEELDLTGYKVMAVYSDGTQKDVTAQAEYAGYDAKTAGTQTITVTYEGKTATFTVVVKDENGGGSNPGGQNPDGQNPSGQKPGDADNGTSQSQNNKADSGVKTGDAAQTGMTVVMLLVAGSAVVVILRRKKKYLL